MSDKEKNFLDDEELDNAVIVLTDNETGEDKEFEVIARAVIDGKLYYAFSPAGEESFDIEVLAAREEGEDILFESIDDDDEFEKVEDYFNDLLFGNVDFDN